MTDTRVHDVLDGAILALETQGHVQGKDLDPGTGRLCLQGALVVGSGVVGLATEVRNGKPGVTYFHWQGGRPYEFDGVYRQALEAVRRALPAAWQTGNSAFHDVTAYNDRACRGGEDAILVLKEARELP